MFLPHSISTLLDKRHWIQSNIYKIILVSVLWALLLGHTERRNIWHIWHRVWERLTVSRLFYTCEWVLAWMHTCALCACLAMLPLTLREINSLPFPGFWSFSWKSLIWMAWDSSFESSIFILRFPYVRLSACILLTEAELFGITAHPNDFVLIWASA